jgi:hypothetical protein
MHVPPGLPAGPSASPGGGYTGPEPDHPDLPADELPPE